jgi:hypothetical protein
MVGDDLRESVGLAHDGTTKDEEEVGSAEEAWENDRYNISWGKQPCRSCQATSMPGHGAPVGCIACSEAT